MPLPTPTTTLFAGMVAPSFVLRDQHGAWIASTALLARGPLVVFFFRAFGCDYCRRELAAVERSAGLLQSRGARIVGIARYGADECARLRLETAVSFPVLNDADGSVAAAFGVGPAHRPEWAPVPARFVISSGGVVVYGDADPDYTNRPDAAELAPVVWRAAGADIF
jgi:peroxiredoxin